MSAVRDPLIESSYADEDGKLDALALRAQEGEDEAVHELWTAVQPMLKRVAVTFGALPEDVPDVVQETMWLGHSHLDAFDPGLGRFKGWIATILIRQLRNMKRSDTRRFRLLDRFKLSAGRAAARSAHGALDARFTLDKLLVELTPRQREVVALYEIAGLSAREVATALEISEPGVRSVARQARNKMARAAKRMCTSEEGSP